MQFRRTPARKHTHTHTQNAYTIQYTSPCFAQTTSNNVFCVSAHIHARNCVVFHSHKERERDIYILYMYIIIYIYVLFKLKEKRSIVPLLLCDMGGPWRILHLYVVHGIAQNTQGLPQVMWTIKIYTVYYSISYITSWPGTIICVQHSALAKLFNTILTRLTIM